MSQMKGSVTHHILEQPDGVDGRAVDRGEEPAGGIRADGEEREVKAAKALANLLEGRAHGDGGVDLVRLGLDGGVACGLAWFGAWRS